MRILYLSVHEILEYDELRLFSELGHECFSLGAYTQPGGEEHRKRPSLPLPYDPHFIELSLQYDRRKLHPEMLKGVDAVIIMHEPSFVGYHRGASDWHPDLGEGNWPLFREYIKKGGRVIWRSIGQSIPHVERLLQPFRDEGLELVRYSPAERTIADYAGEDAVIRFYKDPEEYTGWTGENRKVVNFTQSLQARGRFVGASTFQRVTAGLPRTVYGPGNEDMGDTWGGLLSPQAQIGALRQACAYFYHGTYPASYTLSFIEAMMTGTPMVAVGPRLGNGDMFPDQQTYEIPDIIVDGLHGFVSDNPALLRTHLERLLKDDHLAKSISAFGRQRAIELFGKAKIKSEWKQYLEARP